MAVAVPPGAFSRWIQTDEQVPRKPGEVPQERDRAHERLIRDLKLDHDGPAVDARDIGTPDAWISRDSSLIRLTGREALAARRSPRGAFSRPRAFTTFGTTAPCVCASFCSDREYERVPLNSGRADAQVPKLDWATHRVEVSGLVSKPRSFSMDEIAALEPRTLAVTLVCSGNRRKEQNLVKHSLGFNYGACGLSTSEWTGARLCDVLRACGVDERRAQWVWLGSPHGELPKGSDGSYATQIPIHMAMDPDCDVILAYKQNGEHLPPDHGFPVRAILPCAHTFTAPFN
eukprot:tig00020904_g15149.t1